MKFTPSFRQLDRRESRLLMLFASVLVCCVMYYAHAYRQSATEALMQAQQRHLKAKSEAFSLASTSYREAITRQKAKLSFLRMIDATPEISKLRMREELAVLAMGAGFKNLKFIDELSVDNEPEHKKAVNEISVVSLSLEADFDWHALNVLFEEIAQFHTGYLVKALEVRREGNVRKMRLNFRILHQAPGTVQ